MADHLVLRLEAPLMSFGGDMVDAYGVVRDFPARSMITGLIANALGWDRADSVAHDRLQARMVMGSVRLREGQRFRDFQTAQLAANDKGWTTRAAPEGRAGGADSDKSPHIRYRDADADALLLVVLRLNPVEEMPSLGDVAAALERPERHLFLGRKPFLPSGPLMAGTVAADSILEALRAALALVPGAAAAIPPPRGQWPQGEGGADMAQADELTDERNWATGVHAGLRRVLTGRIAGEAT